MDGPNARIAEADDQLRRPGVVVGAVGAHAIDADADLGRLRDHLLFFDVVRQVRDSVKTRGQPGDSDLWGMRSEGVDESIAPRRVLGPHPAQVPVIATRLDE